MRRIASRRVPHFEVAKCRKPRCTGTSSSRRGREADPTRGGQDHRAEAIAFCDAFPDNKVKNRPYDVLFGEGDFTCFVTRFTGTFTAPMKQPNGSVIEPTGKSFDVLYSTAAKWRDGRIIEEYLFWDNGTFLTQVGLA